MVRSCYISIATVSVPYYVIADFGAICAIIYILEFIKSNNFTDKILFRLSLTVNCL